MSEYRQNKKSHDASDVQALYCPKKKSTVKWSWTDCMTSCCHHAGEEKLNILEIVKPVETVEVVIDPDAAGEEGTLVEEGQLIAVERSSLSDDTLRAGDPLGRCPRGLSQGAGPPRNTIR